MVQWLECHAPTAEGTGSIPDRGTKILQAMQCYQFKTKISNLRKRKKEKKKTGQVVYIQIYRGLVQNWTVDQGQHPRSFLDPLYEYALEGATRRGPLNDIEGGERIASGALEAQGHVRGRKQRREWVTWAIRIDAR